MLIHMSQAKRVLEIGMFTGYGALSMAEGLPEDGCLVACELEPYLKEFAQPIFDKSPHGKKITVKIGSAMDTLKELAAKGDQFDMVFIDADKINYINYYNFIMDSNLLRLGGVICVDNSLYKAKVYLKDTTDSNGLALREFNQCILNDPRVEQVIVPLRDGISLIRRVSVASAKSLSQVDITDDEVFRGVQGRSILDRMRLDGKVAYVTGGGQGIGRAFAHALGEAGAKVAVVDIDQTKAEAVVKELFLKGIHGIPIKADISKADDVQRMVDTIVSKWGTIHIACNNAGINRNSASEDTSLEEWDQTFNVNLRGTFMCCQAAGRVMLKQGYGKIINTASMASLIVPHPQKQLSYNTSKAGVVKMTQTLGTEWIDRGVRVNCISPGIVDTPLIHSEDLRPLVQRWLSDIPAGRLAQVTDLQAAVVYLASDVSDYMTGHNLVIEGGQSLW
ncbi:D-threitol dehydrogenase isoform X3 [Cyprinodon tularosa]|nr:D-threitol dehydrogenase isoform X3 [Cyprinodon tularosa]